MSVRITEYKQPAYNQNILSQNTVLNKLSNRLKTNVKVAQWFTPLIIVSAAKSRPKTLSGFFKNAVKLPVAVTGAMLASKAVYYASKIRMEKKGKNPKEELKKHSPHLALHIGSFMAKSLALYYVAKTGISAISQQAGKSRHVHNFFKTMSEAVNSSVVNKKIYEPAAKKVSAFFMKHPSLRKPVRAFATLGALTLMLYEPLRRLSKFVLQAKNDGKLETRSVVEFLAGEIHSRIENQQIQ